MAAIQGTTSLTGPANSAFECEQIFGSQITGTNATLTTTTVAQLNGSVISGSSLAVPAATLGGMCQVISGSTAAANATVSATHGLGAAPSWVGLTSEGTSGGLQLMSRGTSVIHIQANIGTVGYRAILIK